MRKAIGMRPSFNLQSSEVCRRSPVNNDDVPSHRPLTNEDFRTMFTPRIVSVPSMRTSGESHGRSDLVSRGENSRSPICNPEPPTSHHSKKSDDFGKVASTPKTHSRSFKRKREDENGECGNDGNLEKSKMIPKFKSPFAVQPENELSQIAKKFKSIVEDQDERAKSDGRNFPSTSDYHDVSSCGQKALEVTEANRQRIHDSKYLGGKIENTYLVKGLDYLLLQKTREEIREKACEKSHVGNEGKAIGDEGGIHFKTNLGKKIYEAVFKKHPKKAAFRPNLAYYVFDLNRDHEDSDIPTTVMRSKMECPDVDSESQTINDAVISNAASIFSRLRQGKHLNKARNQREDSKVHMESDKTQKFVRPKHSDDSIYGDIGDYIPSLEKSESKEIANNSSDGKNKKSYFEKSRVNSVVASTSKCELSRDPKKPAHGSKTEAKKPRLPTALSYAECYPGALENEDTLIDSDDEADYSRMDKRNGKGEFRRCDFDTEEEFGSYMSSREALPKAAFQYGVKMEDGRRTKKDRAKFGKAKLEDRVKLDRELKQINRIIAERKNAGARCSDRGEEESRMRPRVLL